jgi:hypothetical protein
MVSTHLALCFLLNNFVDGQDQPPWCVLSHHLVKKLIALAFSILLTFVVNRSM